MGFQHRKSKPNGKIGDYGKFMRKKAIKKLKQQTSTHENEHRILTQKETSEITLKRLHILGSQKFGASPYSEHFERWLLNIEAVITEFTMHPDIGVDAKFQDETKEALDTVKRQLMDRKQAEELINQDAGELEKFREQLKQTDLEYAMKAMAIKVRKRRETNRLNTEIEYLKREQDMIIRLKTGFFRFRSKRKREEKEAQIVQDLNSRQTELELTILDFAAEHKELKDDYDQKRDPLSKQIKNLQKTIGISETDASLEERWFACGALIDAVNSYLQRKAAASPKEET